jgi:hypothetical protein
VKCFVDVNAILSGLRAEREQIEESILYLERCPPRIKTTKPETRSVIEVRSIKKTNGGNEVRTTYLGSGQKQ